MNKIIKYPLILIWRLWFYILVFLSILMLFPVLIIVISKEKWYPAFYKIAHFWGKAILFGMGFRKEVKTLQKIESGKSYMFIANHTSMIDIMLMLAVVKNPAIFVGKEELTKIPLFGFVFKQTSITVNRDDRISRNNVIGQAQQKLNKGFSICIFPEGLVPSDKSVVLSDFKNGAFRLAIEYQIPIVPLIFYDCKKRFSYTFFSGSTGKLRVKIDNFIETKGTTQRDRERIKKQTFNLIYNELIEDSRVNCNIDRK